MNQESNFDIIVVGSRCAGAPLAMLLARLGHRVLIVDRSTFPSDTMSTHFIQSPGMARLARWGLIDQMWATGCPPVTKARFFLGNEVIDAEVPLPPGIVGLASPRRHHLDKILVDAAIEAGAEMIEGVAVDSLIYEGERVTGIRGHTSAGDFEARGRFVVGADGRNSTVAREVSAAYVRDDTPTTAGYYSYFSGVECQSAETYLIDGLFVVAFPTNDGLTTIAVEWPREMFDEIKRDREGRFLAALDQAGDMGARVRGGQRAEPFVGASDLPNHLRKAWGPGWALAGDACYHKDPAPADGISDAFRAADLLAEAIDEIMNGAVEEAALDRYEERHALIAIPLLDAAERVVNFDHTPQQRLEAFLEIRMRDTSEVAELIPA